MPEQPAPSPGRPFDRPFDLLSEEALRASGSLKWTRYGPAIGAFVAEMDFGTAPAVRAALHEAVDAHRMGYLTERHARAMAEACADWQARHHGWRLPPDWVTPLPDVLAGLQAAIEHFTAPGTPVVLPTPAYMPFLVLPGLLGRELVQVPMVCADGRYGYDLAALDRALAGGGLLVHTNPHNPTGRVFGEAEQRALAAVVERHDVRVFSDEIHAPLVLPGAVHRPYAALSPTTAAHTVTATSASKAWNVPGLKAAQLLLSNPRDAAHWVEVGWLTGHGASTPGVLAHTAAWRDGDDWLAGVLDYLDGSRRLLGALLAEHLPGVRWTPPEGTYLAWLDCRELGLPAPAGRFFLDRAGVALVDGPECGAAGAGHVRLNLATPRPVLRTVVERMGRAVAAG